MEVTVENFEEVFPMVVKDIETAHFLAVDLEMTGVSPNGARRNSDYDTYQDKYDFVYQSSESFLPIQFGLSLFLYEDDMYTVKVYNFYVFPRKYKWIEPRFVCQGSSLEFLRDNSFDFNKWIDKGIPFLNRDQENKILESMDKVYSSEEIQINNPDDLEYVNGAMKDIADWLETDTEDLILPPESPFRRKIVYGYIERNYPERLKAVPFVTPEKFKTIKITRNLEDPKFEERQKLKEHVGFRKIIDKIIESKKPLIGHNCMLDLAHIYRYFYKQLPKEIAVWIETLHEILPIVFDTKYMAEGDLKKLFPNTSLESLYNIVKDDSNRLGTVKIRFPEEFPNYLDGGSESYHEAGYDAFITGYIFLELANELTGDFSPQIFLNPLVKDNENKLNIFRMISGLSLNGENKLTIFKNVLVLDVPKEIDNKGLISIFGSINQKVYITWHSSGVCFAKCSNITDVSEIWDKLTGVNPPFKFFDYETFLLNREDILAKKDVVFTYTPKKPRRKLMINSPLAKLKLLQRDTTLKKRGIDQLNLDIPDPIKKKRVE